MITRRIIGGILIGVILCVFCLRSCCVILHNKEVRTNLCRIYQLQTAYKAMFGRYTDKINEIIIAQDTLAKARSETKYRVLIKEASDSSFKAIVISVVDFDGDGQYSQWMIDETGDITKMVKD